jgi:hypothetical protein
MYYVHMFKKLTWWCICIWHYFSVITTFSPTYQQAQTECSYVVDGKFRLSSSCLINLKINSKMSSTTHNKMTRKLQYPEWLLALKIMPLPNTDNVSLSPKQTYFWSSNTKRRVKNYHISSVTTTVRMEHLNKWNIW